MKRPGVVNHETDPNHFRSTLRRLLTGVAVVTTVDSGGRRWGLTANSFASVSLDPPLVSICVSKHAGSFTPLNDCTYFGVSVLSASQEDLARRFASPIADKFEGVELVGAERRAPILGQSTAWLLCRIERQLEAGDHMLIVGRVDRCSYSSHPPLGYCEGNFLTLSAEAGGRNVNLPGRDIVVGWLVEEGGRIVLARNSRVNSDEWSLPIGRLTSGRTMSDALYASGRLVFGGDVEPSFLYSVIDVSETETCHVYRARLHDRIARPGRLRSFDEHEVPWSAIPLTAIKTILKRYFDERKADRFGVYLNVGRGRLARISDERAWDPAWDAT